jgi:hypothetical protein
VYKWILPSLLEILTDTGSTVAVCSSNKAQQQWRLSVAATEQLLLNMSITKGLVLAAPAPVFSQVALTHNLQTITFTAKPFNPLALMPFQMSVEESTEDKALHEPVLPLIPTDPLAMEQFCLVFTEKFSLVLLLSEDSQGKKTFGFSFEPEVVERVWKAIGARVILNNADLFADLEESIQNFSLVTPDYRTVMQFSQLLLQELPSEADTVQKNYRMSEENVITPVCTKHLIQSYGNSLSKQVTTEDVSITLDTRSRTRLSCSESSHISDYPRKNRTNADLSGHNEVKFIASDISIGEQRSLWEVEEKKDVSASPLHSATRHDIELLQAFAHEVRTPLTTIRTITRLLLKQRDLHPKVVKRLEMIDRECTEQIDRMELLFRAVELETSPSVKSINTQLTPMSLDRVLQQSIPRWQEAASKRNLTLDVVLPQELPTVVSNPQMLDRVLTGLMENFTRSLPAGSHIQVQVIPAGDQLKLQLSPKPELNEASSTKNDRTPPIRKAIGQLLMFQPETGTISLNLNVTKHLFQAIGGKLIVRQRPHHGEVLTIFLPLEEQ